MKPKNYTIWINILSRTQPEILPPGLIDELDPHALGYHDSAESVENLFSVIAGEFPEVDNPIHQFTLEISAELEVGNGHYSTTHEILVGDFETAEKAADAATTLGDKYYHDCTRRKASMTKYDFDEGSTVAVIANMEENTVSLGFLDSDAFDGIHVFTFTPEETEALADALRRARYDLARIPRDCQ